MLYEHADVAGRRHRAAERCRRHRGHRRLRPQHARRPFSDIDLLFLAPDRAAADDAPRHRIHALFHVGPWPEGPATPPRSIAQCLADADSDSHHPHQPARCAAADRRDEQLLERFLREFERAPPALRRGRLHCRQAGRAHLAAETLRRKCFPGRAEHQGGQGRPARPAGPSTG